MIDAILAALILGAILFWFIDPLLGGDEYYWKARLLRSALWWVMVPLIAVAEVRTRLRSRPRVRPETGSRRRTQSRLTQ